jgi:hypothetical protein
LTLIQCGERPARYGRSLCFDTKPSTPISGPVRCLQTALEAPPALRARVTEG